MEVYVAIVLAVLTTLVSIAGLLRSLHRRRIGKFPGAVLLPSLVGLLLAWPCFFIGVVVGGNYGGGWSAALGERMGVSQESPLIPIGIGLGIWFVFTFLEVVAVGLVGIIVLGTKPRQG